MGLLSGGAQRTAAVMYRSFSVSPSLRSVALGWLANPVSYSTGYMNLPEASPVNGRPVRLEPCAPGRSHDQHPRLSVAESRHRLAPVLAVAIRPPLLAGHLLAISDEARAASAGHDFAVEDG